MDGLCTQRDGSSKWRTIARKKVKMLNCTQNNQQHAAVTIYKDQVTRQIYPLNILAADVSKWCQKVSKTCFLVLNIVAEAVALVT